MLIKAVNKDEPKMLSGSDQNGTWSGPGAAMSPGADGAPPAERHDPTPGAIEQVNEVTPLPPREGKRPARGADEAAEEG